MLNKPDPYDPTIPPANLIGWKPKVPDPDDEFAIGQTNEDGVLICGARAGGEDLHPCRSIGLFPNGRCKFHGGKSLAGPLHQNYKHGRYSRALPAHFQERYTRFLSDPEMTGMRDEIALYRSRMEELLSVMDADIAENTWHRLVILWDNFRFAVATNDTEEQQELFGRLTDFIARADRNRTAWKEINKTTEILHKLTMAEHKKTVDNKHVVSTEQVLNLLTHMIIQMKEAVYRYVDPETAKCIIQDVATTQTRLLGPARNNGGSS